jgi:SAM-dependent methyltransferase
VAFDVETDYRTIIKKKELGILMADDWKNVECLLCGSKESGTVFPGHLHEKKGDDLSAYFSASRVSATHGPIVRCKSCGFVYADPQPSSAVLEQTYRNSSSNAYTSENAARLRTAERMLDLVEKKCPGRGALLDVGCSTGLFLQGAQRRGWNVLGIEPSSLAIEECRRCNLPVKQGVIETVNLQPEAFDVVTMWDVLEHSVNPRIALEKVRLALKTGGTIFINVPNVKSWMARILRHRWPLLLVEHLWYFSPATLNRLFKQNGFGVVAKLSHPVTFSMGFIFIRLAQQGLLPPELTTRIGSNSLLKKILITFRMGEMTVVAQKLDNP